VNGNGRYDVGIDALDDGDVEITAGFYVVPEFSAILILPLFALATLLAKICMQASNPLSNNAWA
jgi:hypothetical protein